MNVKATRKEMRKALGPRAYDEVAALKQSVTDLQHAYAALATDVKLRTEQAEFDAKRAVQEATSTTREYGQFKSKTVGQRVRWVLFGR